MSMVRSRMKATGWRIALGVGLVLAAAALRPSTAEAKPSCSDQTPNNRECTFTEELGYCIENAMRSANECIEDESSSKAAICLAAYDLDFYACFPSALMRLFT